MSDVIDLFPDSDPEKKNNKRENKPLDDPKFNDGNNEETKNDEVNSEEENYESDEKSGKPGRKLKGRYVLIAIAVVIGATIVGYYANRSVIIQKVTIDGNYFTTKQSVKKHAQVPLNEPPDSINFFRIIHNVIQMPYIKMAYVRVIPPSTLNIHVIERQPIAMLVNGSHKAYVDSSGVELPIIAGKSRNVPIVYGFNASNIGDTLKSNEFKDISRFLIDAQKNKLAEMTISEVAFSKKKGVVALTQDNGVKLIFGKKDYNQRLTYWDAFCKQIIPKEGIKDFLYVDLRYKGQIVTQKM